MAGPVEPLDDNKLPGPFRSFPSVAKVGPTALLAWQESVAAEGGLRQVFGQWLDDGRPPARAFRLSAAPARAASGAAVALAPDGLAFVVWDSWGERGAERRIEGVWGRREEGWRPLVVDTSLVDFPARPAVAALSDDAFVVVWQGTARSGRRALNGQLFHRSESGLVGGEPFAVDEEMEILRPARVAGGPEGFEVVWCGRREREEARSWGQRFDASGRAVGPGSVLGEIGRPESTVAVLGLKSLGSAVAWVENTPTSRTIWLRFLDAAGPPSGPAHKVADSPYPVFDGPLLAVDGADHLLILWTSHSADSEKIEIHGVLWDGERSQPIAPPFSSQTNGTGNTAWPVLAGDDGSFLLVRTGGPRFVRRTLTARPANELNSPPYDRSP